MKKLYASFLAIIMFLSVPAVSYASSSQQPLAHTTIEDLGNGFYGITALEIQTSNTRDYCLNFNFCYGAFPYRIHKLNTPCSKCYCNQDTCVSYQFVEDDKFGKCILWDIFYIYFC